MKTAIKLVLLYFLMQILAALVVGPFSMLYVYIADGALNSDKAEEIGLAPTMLLGFVFMGIYLWRKNYLTDDKRLYSPLTASYLVWSLLAGLSTIFLISALVSQLSFLPDWLNQTFSVLQSGWLGIVCISVLGPILEELLFRGAITKALLRKYSPVKAILISGLIFGLFHVNPAQVVSAALIGFFLAWLYYKTRSLVPCILIHILNNSLSVYLNLKYPEVEELSDLMGNTSFLIFLLVSVLLLFLSLKKLNEYKLSDININTTTEV
ncbi:MULTISPECIES: CPBP family intramembrane glutamic endopeptidase [Bacteroides]|uniref:CPBP family intramembrane glutamic endopeptidase n=1 Tax=Bacteroides TaxID=816 RepID=UPI000E43B00C|nr:MULTISPECIES: type II CAAX endopeptidase family protein [Bacteroides]RGM49864.1 CPBP family intramembrane metalloprotease [Bacteroides sp. OM08-11]